MRTDEGAGPVTLGIDIGVIKMIITHAAAVQGFDISPEPFDLARIALKWLGLIGSKRAFLHCAIETAPGRVRV